MSPDGTHQSYGEAGHDDARIWTTRLDSQGTAVATAWLVDRQWAPSTAASINYSYANDRDAATGTSAYRPARISYAGRSIGFNATDPSISDRHTGWTVGREITNQFLITQVVINAPGAPEREYELEYTNGPRTNRFLVNEVDEKILTASPISRPIAHFEWNSSPNWNTPPGHAFIPSSTSLMTMEAPEYATVTMMDMNGDGLPDMLANDVIGGTIAETFAVPNQGGNADPWEDLQVVPGSIVANPDLSVAPLNRGIPFDYDHDGIDDLLLYDIGGSANWRVQHTGHDASGNIVFDTIDTGLERPFGAGVSHLMQTKLASVHLADVNGDGMLDLIQCSAYEIEAPATWSVHYWVPTGSPTPGGKGFEGGAGTEMVGASLENYPCDAPVYVVDVDGDQRQELVMPTAILHNDGDGSTGIQKFWHWASPALAVGAEADGSWKANDIILPWPKDDLLVWADVNGDGLPDAVQTNGARTNFLLGLNHLGTFDALPQSVFPTEQVGPIDGLNVAVTLDINSDGRQDILLPLEFSNNLSWTALMGTGSLSAPLQSHTYSELTSEIYFDPDSADVKSDSALIPRALDLNGDGATDLLLPNPGHFDSYYNSSADEDTLKTITYGNNARTVNDPLFRNDVSVFYDHTIDRARTQGIADETQTSADEITYLAHWDPSNQCNYPRNCIVVPRRIVLEADVNDGQDGLIATTYQYRDGRADTEGLGWIGFGTRIAHQEQFLTIESYDNIHLTSGDYWGAGRPLTSRQLAVASPSDPDPQRIDLAVSVITTAAQDIDHGGGYHTEFSKTVSTVQSTFQEDFDPGSGESLVAWAMADGAFTAVSRTTTIISGYDDFGNSLSATTTTDGVDQTTTRTTTYQNDTTNWILGRPLTNTTCSSVGVDQQCRKSSDTYDGFGRISVRDVATTDNVYPGNANDTAFEETFTYDSFGNLKTRSKKDIITGKLGWECAQYDTFGVFPTASRSALNHYTYYSYDARHGNKVAEIDSNDLTTQWGYDQWGRVTKEVRPDGKTTTVDYQQVADPDHGRVIQIHAITGGGDETTTELDERARPIIQWSGTMTPYCVSPCPSKPRTKQYMFWDHVFPMVIKKSMPVDESVTVSQVSAWTTMTHDSAGRVLVSTPLFAGGATSYSYDRNVTTIHEPMSVTKTVAVDGLGRSTLMTEPAGTTAYEYGPFSQTTKVVAAGSEVDTWSNAFGSVIYIKDPDTGVTNRRFDAFGHVKVEADAANRVTTYDIDVAGRPITRTDIDGYTQWNWDTAMHGVGRIASVTTAPTATAAITSEEQYTYTNHEQLTSKSLIYGGETFTTSFSYDIHGNPDHVFYPSNGGAFAVENHFDNYGNLVRVDDVGTKQPIWTLTGSDNEGHNTSEVFGNQLVTTARSYYLDRGALHTIQSGTSAAPHGLQNLDYVWEDRLNLQTRTDHNQTTSNVETFTYDDSDRLQCASFQTGHCSTTIIYENNGNIHEKRGIGDADVGVYQYDAVQIHAVRNAGGDHFTYDKVGNQITRPGATISYSAANLPNKIHQSQGGDTVYSYDGLEQRIAKSTSADSTVYAGGVYERVSHSKGGTDHFYSVLSGERVVAIVKHSGSPVSQDINYLLVDHLGSPDVIVNSSGIAAQARSFDAFGKARSTTWGSSAAPPASILPPTGYAGQEDDSLSLVNMKGRIYDPRLGRFLQADPLVARSTNQGWNRYSYVRNNPLRFVDPSGFGTQPLPPSSGGGGDDDDDDESSDPTGGPSIDGGEGNGAGPQAGDALPVSPTPIGPGTGNGGGCVLVSTGDTSSNGTTPPPGDDSPSAGGGYGDPTMLSTGAGGFTSGQDIFQAMPPGHHENWNGLHVGVRIGEGLAITQSFAMGARFFGGLSFSGSGAGWLGTGVAARIVTSPLWVFMGAGGIGGGIVTNRVGELLTATEEAAPVVAEDLGMAEDQIGPDIASLERVGSGLTVDFEKPIRDAAGNIIQEFPATPTAHGFPDEVDNFAEEATRFQLRDGATLFQVEGSLNGVPGRFEWIVDQGFVTHRMFVGGGSLNGVPIVR